MGHLITLETDSKAEIQQLQDQLETQARQPQHFSSPPLQNQLQRQQQFLSSSPQQVSSCILPKSCCEWNCLCQDRQPGGLDVRGMFDWADRNHDGVIDRAEWNEVKAASVSPLAMHPDDLVDMTVCCNSAHGLLITRKVVLVLCCLTIAGCRRMW